MKLNNLYNPVVYQRYNMVLRFINKYSHRRYPIIQDFTDGSRLFIRKKMAPLIKNQPCIVRLRLIQINGILRFQ